MSPEISLVQHLQPESTYACKNQSTFLIFNKKKLIVKQIGFLVFLQI